MMRRMIMVAALAAVLGAAGTASAFTWWMPLREVRSQAYLGTNGEAIPRYQWRTVTDARQTGACVLVLTDTVTGQFAIAAVPPEACDE